MNTPPPNATSHGAASPRSLVRVRPGESGPPLFCVHGLGGHVLGFLPLARGLRAPRPVYALQALGLDPGQTPHDCIDTMADDYVAEVRQTQPHGPYLLCGWSMGGAIALAMATRLTALGETVDLVAMIDAHRSVTGPNAPQIDDQAVMEWIGPQLQLDVTGLRRLPLEEKWRQIAQQAQRVHGGGVAEIRRLAEVCKAHLAAAARHVPQPYPGRVVLFQAAQTRGGSPAAWRELCPQIHIEQLPGDHYSILRKPDVDALVERLERFLPAGGSGETRTA